ncbi:MAG: TlpA disulfide reductase family protein [Balneolaceae bacterium]|nr:TlpA disulfide reductase family protein [Balneolaceae bacterium]
MRIDPKYFNVFIFILAIVAAALIVFYSVSTDRSNQRKFREFITSSDSLGLEYWNEAFSNDTLSIEELDSRFVLVDFWATWSVYGDERHRHLHRLLEEHPEILTVLAASVRNPLEEVREYREQHGFPFTYVDGTRIFTKYRVPGIPTMILYGPDGRIRTVFVGFEGEAQIDSLNRVISHGS